MLSLGTPNAFSAIACYRHPKPVSARHEVTRSSRRYDDLAHALDETTRATALRERRGADVAVLLRPIRTRGISAVRQRIECPASRTIVQRHTTSLHLRRRV